MHDLNITIVNRTSRKSEEVQTPLYRKTKQIAICEGNNCVSIKYHDIDCASDKKCFYQVEIVNNRRYLAIRKNHNRFEIIMTK